jgi:hypothetical protein
MTTHSEMSELANVVATLFGTESRCIPAAAVMVEALTELGYTAHPRPVSAVIVHPPSDTLVVSSEYALEAAREAGVRIPDASHVDALGWAGHMVVVVEEPAYLWDVNFAQFSRGSEIPAIVVGLPIHPEDTAGNFWEFNEPRSGLHVLYKLGPEPPSFAATWLQTVNRGSRLAHRLATAARTRSTDQLRVDELRALVSAD